MRTYAVPMQEMADKAGAFDFVLPGIDGRPLPLAQWRGSVLLAVNVADAARRAWGVIQSQSTKPVKLELQIPESAVLQADSALLQIVLRNLLANALRHGEGLGVSCVLEGSIICASPASFIWLSYRQMPTQEPSA